MGARMDHPDASLGQDPGRWRDYLAVLAQIQVSPRLRVKVDVSGVAQTTLLEAFRGRPRIQGGPAGEAAWLRQILAHNLADEIRKPSAGKRDIARERSLEAALDDSSARLGNLLAANQSTPRQQAVNNEKDLRLAAALARLPETQREALVLQHWHNWSLGQIAEHLGKSRAAVAGLIKRGLEKLRSELSPEE
ncbi:MAG: RNA polymerase sigma factor [Candidatus Acidiferrum sp.]